MNGVARRCLSALCALATGLSGSEVVAAASAHAKVRVEVVVEPSSLNPLFMSGSTYTMMSELLFEPLFREGPGNRLVPGLALQEPTLKNG